MLRAMPTPVLKREALEKSRAIYAAMNKQYKEEQLTALLMPDEPAHFRSVSSYGYAVMKPEHLSIIKMVDA